MAYSLLAFTTFGFLMVLVVRSALGVCTLVPVAGSLTRCFLELSVRELTAWDSLLVSPCRLRLRRNWMELCMLCLNSGTILDLFVCLLCLLRARCCLLRPLFVVTGPFCYPLCAIWATGRHLGPRGFIGGLRFLTLGFFRPEMCFGCHTTNKYTITCAFCARGLVGSLRGIQNGPKTKAPGGPLRVLLFRVRFGHHLGACLGHSGANLISRVIY